MRNLSIAVVGIDGSPSSLRAARWAADEADRRRLALHLLFCADLLPAGSPFPTDPDGFDDLVVSQGGRTLDAVRRDLLRSWPGLVIETRCEHGDPRHLLVQAGEQAALTVLGAGAGRVAEVLQGSLTLHVTAHAMSPVAVIPEDSEDQAGPVLVGLDGSVTSERAIGFAFDEAAVRGVEVVAVMAVDRWLTRGFARKPGLIDADEAMPEHALMSEQLAGWSEKFPDVGVQRHVFHGPPADCLLGFAGHAPADRRPQMIVVGSRGRGPLTGLILGSTSHTLIARATCPVVVVRSE